MAEFRPHVEAFREAGVQLAVIGSGGPSFARGFRERTGTEIPIFSDEKLAAFKVANLRRGIARTLHPASFLKGVRALWRGNRQTGLAQGDPWQQGGLLLVRRDGALSYRYISRYPGDHPAIADVLAAARAASPP